ncbi:unnamed protein product [Enterobius vermicularis]|uniref:Cadherin domain-containing protein n=1 Tax=Enterobius vermicularis TaxID=51028 RepID=A0A3P6I159_ENTVE|nr:unnamed protein product [Enterobius vermicularis]
MLLLLVFIFFFFNFQFISVDETSGEITVRAKLDHELESVYDFVVVPISGIEKSMHVYIHVNDENDNAPEFPVSSISVEVSEYARLHSEISIPSAVDKDSPPYNVQKYQIKSGNVNNAFRLATRNVNSVEYVDLVVNGELDREYRAHYELIIEAADGGNPPKIGTLNVSVNILDANDNSPEFSEPRYSAEVPWNVTEGFNVITVRASDPDQGLNSKIAYSLVQAHPSLKPHFGIDSRTGTVTVTDASFEAGSVHELLVVASDHGLPQPLQTTAFLTIVVSKSTEPIPQFDIYWLTDSGNPQIYENATAGYVLARIAVQNVEPNSEVDLEGCDSICLEQTQKQNVYLALACKLLFDRELKSSYSINFLIKNNNVVILEHPVVLEVLDVNDNAPQFGNSMLRVTYNRSGDEEDVVRIVATDADAGENARIRYSIFETDLRCPNGEVQFRVRAEDNGVPSLSSVVDVFVDIIESGEHPPVFSKPLYEVTVREDIDVGTCLLEVSLPSHF